MNIFYKPNIEGTDILLDPKESTHCIKVMRSKIGDKVRLIDGEGGYYEAEIMNEDFRACRITIISTEKNFEPLPYALHLAIAPTKSMDRFEWFVEKATEIGISSITPVICQRSERRNLRKDRLEKVMIAAAKQSVKAFFPKINEVQSFDDWVLENAVGGGYIAHCMDGIKEDIWRLKLSELNNIIIGPEGDFTIDELSFAEQHGFKPVSLGKYRLRTETAGIVACSAIYFNSQV